jgi:hypothetical protein
MKKKNYQQQTEKCDAPLRNILDAMICVNDKTQEMLRTTVWFHRLSPFCGEDEVRCKNANIKTFEFTLVELK